MGSIQSQSVPALRYGLSLCEMVVLRVVSDRENAVDASNFVETFDWKEHCSVLPFLEIQPTAGTCVSEMCPMPRATTNLDAPQLTWCGGEDELISASLTLLHDNEEYAPGCAVQKARHGRTLPRIRMKGNQCCLAFMVWKEEHTDFDWKNNRFSFVWNNIFQ